MYSTVPMETSDVPAQTVPPVGKLLLTPTEAAMVLSISRSLLYQLIMHKRIFSAKVGGARRIPLSAIHKYVEAPRQHEGVG
jgi:excisionase family DNA binding protein